MTSTSKLWTYSTFLLLLVVMYLLLFWHPMPTRTTIGTTLVDLSKKNNGFIDAAQYTEQRKICFFPSVYDLTPDLRDLFPNDRIVYVNDFMSLLSGDSDAWFLAMRASDRPVVYVFEMIGGRDEPIYDGMGAVTANPYTGKERDIRTFCTNGVKKIELRPGTRTRNLFYFVKPVTNYFVRPIF